MTAHVTAIVASARACLDARFRVHGRDPAHGLDCVGLVAVAYALDGVPSGYALRGSRGDDIVAALQRFGFVGVPDERPGDLLLLRAGAFQFHLAIATPAGFVHADAGLRRVVEVPGIARWPLIGRFRPQGDR